MTSALLALALAPALGAAGPAVVLLPLAPEGSVSVKQARGVSAELRDALASGPAAEGLCSLLSASKDDEKQAERCGRDAACLGELAAVRGADLLIAGVLGAGSEGLLVSAVVVAPSAKEALRRPEATLRGDSGDARRVDRLVRTAIGPAALRGALALTGDEGATVTVDGVPAGTLPIAAPLTGLTEGEHRLVVAKPGFEAYQRPVAIVHGETLAVKATLLPLRAGVAPLGLDAPDAAPALPLDVVVLGSIAGGLLVLGTAAGTWSMLDGLAVVERAQDQQLMFPRDKGLMLRGQILAYTADGLWLAGLATAGAAAALGVLDAPAEAGAGKP
jgi:hypothetical protein